MKAAALAALAFLATAALVHAGAFHGLDQYATTNWMPYLRPHRHQLVTIRSLVLPSFESSVPRQLLDLWVYPAAFVPSGAFVAWLAWRARAVVWPALWIAGNAVELAGKLVVSRPHLVWHGMRITSFDNSLPSGHTIRSLLVAGVLAWSFRRGRLAYAWALSVPFALVALGYHTPMDCVAGLFVAAALLLAGRSYRTS